MKRGLLIVFLILVIGITPALAAPAGKPPKPAAKNVIVMIGDGYGFNHHTAASYYEYGKAARQVYFRFPFQFAMSTYSYFCDYDPVMAWSDFEYVKSCYTDSAAAATAMATGRKTYSSAIGVDLDEKPLQNIMERAERFGKATGVVTSVPFCHATPAGFVAHNKDRDNFIELCDEMLYDSALEVIMGCGHPLFTDAHSSDRLKILERIILTPSMVFIIS